MFLALNFSTIAAAVAFLRGSGPKVKRVPSPAGPVIEAYSLSASASPAISTVFRPWSRIWRRIRPASW
jgi:hypothetical protein